MIVDSVTSKYCAEIWDTGAKAIQSQETTAFSSISCAKPKKRRLYTLYVGADDVDIREIEGAPVVDDVGTQCNVDVGAPFDEDADVSSVEVSA